MKLTEGMLKRVFEEVAPEYPDIEAAAHHHRQLRPPAGEGPEQFDVIVTTNMNGDILSDLTSGWSAGWASPRRPTSARRRHLRGRARLGAEVRRQGRHQPHRVILSAVMMLSSTPRCPPGSWARSSRRSPKAPRSS
jgi:isocitrate dehydrogenase